MSCNVKEVCGGQAGPDPGAVCYARGESQNGDEAARPGRGNPGPCVREGSAQNQLLVFQDSSLQFHYSPE